MPRVWPASGIRGRSMYIDVLDNAAEAQAEADFLTEAGAGIRLCKIIELSDGSAMLLAYL